MKKIISLLLAVAMVMSLMTFTAMASTDTVVALAAAKLEEALALGNVSNTNTNGFRTNTTGAAIVAMEDESDPNNTNKIFKVNATVGTQRSTSKTIGLLLGSTGQLADTAVQRFSAKVNLPSVTAGNTEMFMPISAFNATYKETKTVGVTLKNGGAQYYDAATDSYVNFIPNDTMEADHWYLVEVIQDTRIDSPTTKARYAYMNAFVYDAEDGNSLVGTSGWQYVGEAKTYNDAHPGPMGTLIQAFGYPALEDGSPAYVLVDEFKAYKVTNLPTYALSGSVVKSGPANYYLGTDSSSSYRSIMEVFNGYSNGKVITDETEDRAARMQFDIRIPEIADTDVMNFFALYSGKNGGESPCIYANGNANFEGAAHLENGILTIRSYDAANAVYANTVATGTINANEWYTFTYDVDYTDMEAPKGTLTVTDKDGEVVVTAADFAAQPIPKNSYDQWTCVGMYIDSSYLNKAYHVDNMGLYTATTLANLADITARREVFLYEFDDMELGLNFRDFIQTKYAFKTMPSGWEQAAEVSEDVFVWEDGMVLTSTDPFSLTLTYSNPVPEANITTANVELYADGVKMASGYTVTAGELDANNCATEFTIATNALDWGVDYIVRVKAGVSDYNTALSGGVPADAGLYKDYTFSVASLKPDCEITGQFIQGAKDVAAEVIFNSSEDSPLTCYAILAVYEGTKLVGLKKSEEITVPANAEDYVATVDAVELPEGATAKIFVWNNFETMRPWVNPIVLGE